jgi:hypothetical protein
MNKPAALLLIIALELGIIFTGPQAQAVVKQSPVSVNNLAPLSASGSLYSTTPEINRLPSVRDITIFDFLYGDTAPVCWTRPGQNQKQITAISRSGHGVRLTGSRNGEISSPGRPSKAAGDIPSLSLYSLSPPGQILRL